MWIQSLNKIVVESILFKLGYKHQLDIIDTHPQHFIRISIMIR